MIRSHTVHRMAVVVSGEWGKSWGSGVFGPDLLQRINIFLSYLLVLVLPDTKRLGLLVPPFHKIYFYFQAFFAIKGSGSAYPILPYPM